MLDADLKYSNAQALTVTADSTTTLDFGALTDDRGTALATAALENGRLILVVNVVATFAAGGGTNVATKLQDSSDDSTWADTEIVGATIAVANLTAGAEIMRVPIPPTTKRYTKLVYTVTGTGSAGTIDAHLEYGSQS